MKSGLSASAVGAANGKVGAGETVEVVVGGVGRGSAGAGGLWVKCTGGRGCSCHQKYVPIAIMAKVVRLPAAMAKFLLCEAAGWDCFAVKRFCALATETVWGVAICDGVSRVDAALFEVCAGEGLGENFRADLSISSINSSSSDAKCSTVKVGAFLLVASGLLGGMDIDASAVEDGRGVLGGKGSRDKGSKPKRSELVVFI